MRKSQASIEFLTTYGWAFIVLMVVMAALVHFNLISIDVFSRQYCTISPQLECIDFGLYSKWDGNTDNSTIVVHVRNNFNKNITITSFQHVDGTFLDCQYKTDLGVNALPVPNLGRGKAVTVYCGLDDHEIINRNTESAVFLVYFSQLVNGLPVDEHNVTGRIVAKAGCDWNPIAGVPLDTC